MRRPNEDDLALARRQAGAIAARLLGGRAWEGVGVDDVVQEVLLRFAQQDLDELGSAGAWIRTVTVNRCHDVRAAVMRHGNQAIDAAKDADGASTILGWVLGPSAAVMDRQLITYVVSGLSDRERRAVLGHAAGWSNREIADALGYASPEAVATTVARARNKVRQRFESGQARAEILGRQRSY